MKGIDSLLYDHPFTQGLKESWIEFIAGCARNVKFDAGEVLFREGDHANYFYLLRHGAVALEIHRETRDPVIVQTIREGEVIGSSWLVPPYRWQFDARAIELVRAVAFDADCLREKCDNEPALGYEMMKRFVPLLVQRLQTARLQTVDIYGKPTD